MKPRAKCREGGMCQVDPATFAIGEVKGGKITKVIGDLPSKKKVWVCRKCGRVWGKPPLKM